MCKVIGIDISKQTFDVAFLEKNKWEHLVLTNNLNGFKELANHFNSDSHVIMEASGPYYLQLASFLHNKNIKVSVLNPLIIRRYSQMKLIRAKTDKKDAQTIAQYGIDHSPRLWKPQKKITLHIRQIYTALELLSKQINQSKRELEAFEASGVISHELKKDMKRQILRPLQD